MSTSSCEHSSASIWTDKSIPLSVMKLQYEKSARLILHHLFINDVISMWCLRLATLSCGHPKRNWSVITYFLFVLIFLFYFFYSIFQIYTFFSYYFVTFYTSLNSFLVQDIYYYSTNIYNMFFLPRVEGVVRTMLHICPG